MFARLTDSPSRSATASANSIALRAFEPPCVSAISSSSRSRSSRRIDGAGTEARECTVRRSAASARATPAAKGVHAARSVTVRASDNRTEQLRSGARTQCRAGRRAMPPSHGPDICRPNSWHCQAVLECRRPGRGRRIRLATLTRRTDMAPPGSSVGGSGECDRSGRPRLVASAHIAVLGRTG